jgi:hypothetical protein
MVRAEFRNETNGSLDPEDRELIERLIELVQSFEKRPMSTQARADVLLQARRLAPDDYSARDILRSRVNRVR